MSSLVLLKFDFPLVDSSMSMGAGKSALFPLLDQAWILTQRYEASKDAIVERGQFPFSHTVLTFGPAGLDYTHSCRVTGSWNSLSQGPLSLLVAFTGMILIELAQLGKVAEAAFRHFDAQLQALTVEVMLEKSRDKAKISDPAVLRVLRRREGVGV